MPLLRRILWGLSGGIVIGVFCVLVGVGRAVLALITGVKVTMPSRQELGFLLYYVGDFAAAGVVLALLWPLLKTKPLKYFGFVVSGFVLGIAIVAQQSGGLARVDSVGWLSVCIIALVAGLAAGHGFLREDPPLARPNEQL